MLVHVSASQSTVSLDLAPTCACSASPRLLRVSPRSSLPSAPVLGLKRVAAGEAPRGSGRGITGDGRLSVRGTLVVAGLQCGSPRIVVAAGLFLHTFASLNRLPLGFVPEPLLVPRN